MLMYFYIFLMKRSIPRITPLFNIYVITKFSDIFLHDTDELSLD